MLNQHEKDNNRKEAIFEKYKLLITSSPFTSMGYEEHRAFDKNYTELVRVINDF